MESQMCLKDEGVGKKIASWIGGRPPLLMSFA